MEIKEFVECTVKNLDSRHFEYLKEKLIGEYLTFNFIDDEKIDEDVFCEKLVDYFEKAEIKNVNFPKLLMTYVLDLDEVVKRYIPKEPSAKKGDPTPPLPRSLKYYKYAQGVKESRNLTIKQLEDYSRVMMSLYISAINSGMKATDSYEFSTKGLDLEKIISAMKAEKLGIAFPIGKKTLFNLDDLYCANTVTFVITMIMFCHIKNNEVEGDY